MPFLGPVLAAGAGMLAGQFWLGGGFWMVFSAGMVCGFAPIVIYQLWKRWHHRR